ncbi:MAG: T9SS type A sorting domain-containing protein [Bacteroidetes bacterium]|nr:T9SS type A sorting domain-containing protein [Bacteroidota bacterium]
MRVLLPILLFSFPCMAQTLSFSPGMTVEKTVSLNYYNTEYLFIENISDQAVSLNFELVSNTLPHEWSATGCTNLLCYVTIPENGPLGVLQPHEQAYLSINLAVNEFAGDGEIRYAVTNSQTTTGADTVVFHYHAEALQNEEPQPWAQINFAQNILTVFLENAGTETVLYVFDLNGNKQVAMKLQDITSVSLAAFSTGTYIAVVRTENGKELVQKVVKSD